MRKSDLARRIFSYSTAYARRSNIPSISRGDVKDADLLFSTLLFRPMLAAPQRGFSKCTRPGLARGRNSALMATSHMPLSPFFGSSWKRSMASLPPAGALPDSIRYILYGLLFLACAAGTYYGDPFFTKPRKKDDDEEAKHEETITNWSNTHEAHPKYYYQPEDIEDLQRVVRLTHVTSRKIRPVGSGLSPNGLAFSDEGMVNLALMDKVLEIDTKKMQVTVQAGARIDQVVEALKPHGLTLENYASIKEQQVGGFTQVGAHGTGARIPPVDERVVKMKIVTPTQGVLELSADSDPDLFYLARCGLGTLGVVAEVTLQCVPAHRLVENIFVSNMKEVKKNHKKWLQENKHLRYMWIPYTDTVVVVQCNSLREGQEAPSNEYKYNVEVRTRALQDLYNAELRKRQYKGNFKSTTNAMPDKVDERAGMWSGTTAGSRGPSGTVYQDTLSFAALRDKVLAFDPLNVDHVKRVNKAEADYWKKSEGTRSGWSHEILSFDCGGQQWVSEVCFPAGTIDKPDMRDIKFMEELLQFISKHNIPAPAPIEQRWTSGSHSYMSLASPSPDRLFSWVGVIMYLPTEDAEERQAITDRFFEYRKAVQKNLWERYGAFEHWAKVEIRDDEEAEWTRERLQKRLPVELFRKTRVEIDPKNIFGNEFIDKLFPRHRSLEEVQSQDA